MPAPQVAVEPRRHGRLAAHLVAVARAAAERGRDDRIDDARVERVAADADAAGGEHPGAPRADTDHREVGGAAAEVGDDDQLVVIELCGVARRGADRLVLEHDLVEAGLPERLAHSSDGARVVRLVLGAPVADRPADHAAVAEVDRRGRADEPQVRRDHVVERQRRPKIEVRVNAALARWLLIDWTRRPSPSVSG